MKLELNLWHHLLDEYTKFEIDISRHVEKSPENFEKSKTCINNRQNSENKIFTKQQNLCGEVYNVPPIQQIWRIYLDIICHDSKKMNLNYFWL